MFDRDVISALNELIETSRDSEKGFAFAAKASRDPVMIGTFNEAEESCRDAAAQLQDSVRLIGGRADDSGSLKVAAYLAWLSLRNALSAQDDRAILEGREKAEDQTKERYAEAMELDLPQGARAVIQRQYRIAVAIHERIRKLRDRS